MSHLATSETRMQWRPRRPSVPPWIGTFRRAFRYGRFRVGVVITALVVVIALLGPFVAPHSSSAFVGSPFAAPTHNAPFGTDYLGADVFSRALWGGRSVLWMALAATFLGVFMGLVAGLIAGYSRSLLDDFIMGTCDVILAFPYILLPLLFVSLLGPRVWLIVLLVALTHAPRVARLVRGITLEVVHREFVEAAIVIGVPRRRILFGEILPNLTAPLMVEFGLRLTWSIGTVAAISFLGFGIQAPNADWGLMISENRGGLAVQPWAVIVPVVCVAAFAIGTNLIAEGLSRAVAGLDRQAALE